MDKKEILEKLRDDDNYYGEFGRQFLSNSDIYKLLNNPLDFGKPLEPMPALLVGGYFHTAILEPGKLDKYKIIESSSRNTKHYKEMSHGELCLLEHEVDKINLMKDKLLANDVVRSLILTEDDPFIEYEKPGLVELEGKTWKGKADVINHAEKLIIDLKTTSDISKFRNSAYRYNYDSQAYIYSKMFGYEFMFIAICKKTNQIGIFECSNGFYDSGYEKVKRAVEAHDLFFNTEDFDPQQYFITNTL